MTSLRWLFCVLPVFCNAHVDPAGEASLSLPTQGEVRPKRWSHRGHIINVSEDLKLSYFINLDRMPSRRKHMEAQLQDIGLEAHRWRAVDWRLVALGEFDNEYLKPQGIAPALFEKPAKEGNGTIGCFLSHVTAMMEALNHLHGPNDIALIMEDDISIPEKWQYKLQRAVDVAPPDWDLLKLSGWGSARVADLMNKSDYLDPITEIKVKTTTPRPPEEEQSESIWTKFVSAIQAMFKEEDPDVTFFVMKEPFTEPAHWNWGTMGWGSPNYFYSGTGGYLVRGTSIKKILKHLLSQPISDLDAMLLSNGSMRFYEGWPHVFDLGQDAFHGPGLHGHKAMDEFDKSWSKSDTGNITDDASLGAPHENEPDTLQPWQHSANMAELRVVNRDGEAKSVSLSVRGSGAAVVEPASGRQEWPASMQSDIDSDRVNELRDQINKANKASMIRNADTPSRATIKRHKPEDKISLRSAAYARGAELQQKSPGSTSFGHPDWIKSCGVIYLDVGSNNGAQVQKLFEPEKYSDAALAPFDESIGAPEDRRLPSASTGLCALGLEPDPSAQAHLMQLQENYTAKGWNVHFYPFAAWKQEGQVSSDQAAVRSVALADFVKSLPAHTVKLMKVDIRGAEYETVWHMLENKVLCRGTVDTLLIHPYNEADVRMYPNGDADNWQDERTFAALQKHIQQGDCGQLGKASTVTLLDDKTFGSDEAFGDVEAAKLHLKRRNMYAFALAVFALSIFVGYQKFSGETILAKIDNLGLSPSRKGSAMRGF